MRPLLVLLTGCACAFALAAGCINAPRNSQSQIRGSYLTDEEQLDILRRSRQFDKMEEVLQEMHDHSERMRDPVGQLYTTLDMGQFYSGTFVNFREALRLLQDASELNRKVRKLAAEGSVDLADTRHVRYDDRHAKPLVYDYDAIEKRIQAESDRMTRIMGDRGGAGQSASDPTTVLPDVVIGSFKNHLQALDVPPNALDPALFDAASNLFAKAATEHFRQRYKINAFDRAYYVEYNVIKALARSFDVGELSDRQVRGLLAAAEAIRLNAPEDSHLVEREYIGFVIVLCLARLGECEQAIARFEELEQYVFGLSTYLEQTLHDIDNRQRRQNAQNTAIAAATLVFDIGVVIVTRGEYYGRSSIASTQRAHGDAASFARERLLHGETTYSKGFNLLLGMDDQLRLYRFMGRCYHKAGNYNRSVQVNKEAVAIINRMRSTIPSERYRISFASYKDDLYGRLIDSLMRSRRGVEAFGYSEDARSRALVDMMATRKAGAADVAADFPEAARERELNIYQDYMRQEPCVADTQVAYLDRLRSAETAPAAADKAPTNAVADAEIERIRLSRQSLVTVSPVTEAEVREILPPDTSLVEYYVSDHAVYAWIVDKGTSTSLRIDVSPVALGDKIAAIRGALPRQHDAQLQADVDAALRDLHERLWMPVEARLANRSVYLVAHGSLHQLPFEMLHGPDGYLVERYAIAYLPSASVLRLLSDRPLKFDSALIVGNPTIDPLWSLPELPGAEQEARAIAPRFKSSTVLLGKDAVEGACLFRMPDVDVIHLATHGVFDVASPMKSRIYLAKDATNDGIIDAADFYRMNLGASLVTLSACQSSRTLASNGDEIIGLLRGVLFAGSPCVVGSLWKVDDRATDALMDAFYKNLTAGGLPVARSLQEAKRQVIQSGEYGNPYYWAAFTLTGRGQ